MITRFYINQKHTILTTSTKYSVPWKTITIARQRAFSIFRKREEKKDTHEVNSSHDRNDSRISTGRGAGWVARRRQLLPFHASPLLRNSLFWSANHQQQPDQGGREGRNRYMAAITTATMPEPCSARENLKLPALLTVTTDLYRVVDSLGNSCELPPHKSFSTEETRVAARQREREREGRGTMYIRGTWYLLTLGIGTTMIFTSPRRSTRKSSSASTRCTYVFIAISV